MIINRGSNYIKLNEFWLAVDMFDKALELNPNLHSSKVNRGIELFYWTRICYQKFKQLGGRLIILFNYYYIINEFIGFSLVIY